MRLSVRHQTHYTFDGPAPFGLQQIRLTPNSGYGQRVMHWRLEIEGGRVEASFRDQFDNAVALVSIEPGVTHLDALCAGEVEIDDTAGVTGPHSGPAPLWLFKRETPLTLAGPLIKALAASQGPADDLPRLHALSERIHELVRYDTSRTDAGTTAESALETRHGVCQDHAHIFVSAARLMGYSARYVGGYLFTPDRTEHEAGHAWAEAYVESLGWVGFDVSNAISPDDRYVRVATGLDYSDAAPIRGIIQGGGDSGMSVTVQVQQ